MIIVLYSDGKLNPQEREKILTSDGLAYAKRLSLGSLVHWIQPLLLLFFPFFYGLGHANLIWVGSQVQTGGLLILEDFCLHCTHNQSRSK